MVPIFEKMVWGTRLITWCPHQFFLKKTRGSFREKKPLVRYVWDNIIGN